MYLINDITHVADTLLIFFKNVTSAIEFMNVIFAQSDPRYLGVVEETGETGETVGFGKRSVCEKFPGFAFIPRATASDINFQPFLAIEGKAPKKPSRVKFVSSCSRTMSPGSLGPKSKDLVSVRRTHR